MDVSHLLAITLKKIENKGSQMGHTKKIYKKKNTITFNNFFCLYFDQANGIEAGGMFDNSVFFHHLC